jgi:hypothetical protein
VSHKWAHPAQVKLKFTPPTQQAFKRLMSSTAARLRDCEAVSLGGLVAQIGAPGSHCSRERLAALRPDLAAASHLSRVDGGA